MLGVIIHLLQGQCNRDCRTLEYAVASHTINELCQIRDGVLDCEFDSAQIIHLICNLCYY
jgi:hypothetical protein